MKQRVHGRSWWIDQAAWQAFCWAAVWRTAVAFGWGFLMIVVLSIPFGEASKRLYHTYWMWRHPLRCEKGGHAEPLPEVN